MRDQNRCFKCNHNCDIRQDPYDPRFKEAQGIQRYSVWLDENGFIDTPTTTSLTLGNIDTPALNTESLRAAMDSMREFKSSCEIFTPIAAMDNLRIYNCVLTPDERDVIWNTSS